MEPKYQEPVMTSTPLAYRCRQSDDIEVSPIFPVSLVGRKIKSLIPSTSHHLPPVASHGRRKTESNLIENEIGKSSNIASDAKPTLLQLMKKSLMMKSQNPNIVEHPEGIIKEGVDLIETNIQPDAQKKTVTSSTIQENTQSPDTKCTPDKRTSNMNILKSAEQSKSSNVEWCMPQEIKKSCLSKRKTNQQHLKQSVVPSSGIRIHKNIIEKEIDELSPLDLSYPLKKKQIVLENESKALSTIFVEENVLQSSCTGTGNKSSSQTYVLIQQDEQASSIKLCNNNKVNSKHTSTNIHPKRKKKESSEIADEQIKLVVNNRSEKNKVHEETEYDKMGEALDKAVSHTKPRHKIPKKTTASLITGRNKKKYIEGNLDDQLKKSEITKDTQLPTNKIMTEQTVTNTHPIRIEREDNEVVTVEQEIPSTSTGAEQTEADEVIDGFNNIEKFCKSIPNTQNMSIISKITLTAEEFLNTRINEKKCVEGDSDTQIKQLKIIEDAKLPNNKRKSKETLTNSRPKRMKREGNVKPVKQTKMSKNTGAKQSKSTELKKHDEKGEKCDKSVSCSEPGRRISKKTKTQESLKARTNEKNCVEDISDVQLQNIQSIKITKEAKDVINHFIDIEDKVVTDNKIVQDETCPMSAMVVINEPSKKRGYKKKDAKSDELKLKKLPVKRSGLRERNSRYPSETVVNESTNDLKEKENIKSVPHQNEQVEKDSQIAIPSHKDRENIVAHQNEQVEKDSKFTIPTHKDTENIDKENESSNLSKNERVFHVHSCFGTKKDRMMMKEGAVMHIFIHISNFVMTGSYTVQPRGCITKASTNTTYFVVNGTATVRLGPMTKFIRCQDINCSFFIPKNANFTVSNEEKMELRMLFTKFES